MQFRLFHLLFLSLLIPSCENQKDKDISEQFENIKTVKTDPEKKRNQYFKKTEIICDSIYNKGYKVVLSKFSREKSYSAGIYNSVFQFYVYKNGNYIKTFSDSIQSHFNRVKFEDFNNDNVQDILVENISDVRSNLTFHLYLVDTVNNQLTKIRGFEKIKNPNYLADYDIVDNYVMSGSNWASFYKILGDSVVDYDVVIYDSLDENGSRSYREKHSEAIKRILGKNP